MWRRICLVEHRSRKCGFHLEKNHWSVRRLYAVRRPMGRRIAGAAERLGAGHSFTASAVTSSVTLRWQAGGYRPRKMENWKSYVRECLFLHYRDLVSSFADFESANLALYCPRTIAYGRCILVGLHPTGCRSYMSTFQLFEVEIEPELVNVLDISSPNTKPQHDSCSQYSHSA